MVPTDNPMMRSLLPLLLFSVSLHAQQLPDPELTAADRRRIAEAFAKRVESSYVLAEPAKQIAKAIRGHVRSGAYDDIPTASAFAERLTGDARAVQNDRHLRVTVSGGVIPADQDAERPPTPQQKAAALEDLRRINFGVAENKRLDGNVGYLDLELFPPLELAKDAFDAAVASLADTDALIIDARRHRGGDPATVAHLVSWFVPEGTLINETHTRENGSVVQYRAGKLPAPRYGKKVWVLTSKRTFSGGEELAYDFQALKRGTIVGEVTGGGAHPTRPFRIHERFFAMIPFRRSINPVTKTNWEGVGVKPDVAVSADEALQVAHAAALKALDRRPSAAAAAQPEVENSAARALLEAWVKSFNEDDVATRRAWLRANSILPDAQVEQYASMDAEIRTGHGPFDIVRFANVTATSAEAFAKHRKSGMGGRIRIELDPKDPKKIARIELQPADA
jgi:hypothetical protein